MRKTMLAIAAALALGTATMVTGATAAPHGAGFGGGGAHFGGGGGGAHFGGGAHIGAAPHFNGGAHFAAAPHFNGHFAFRGHGFRGHFYGPGVGLYAYGGPWYGGGCWVRRLVWTPFGWRWRLVDVCY